MLGRAGESREGEEKSRVHTTVVSMTLLGVPWFTLAVQVGWDAHPLPDPDTSVLELGPDLTGIRVVAPIRPLRL